MKPQSHKDTAMKPHPILRSLCLTAILALALVNVVHADSGRLLPRDMPPAYTVECAACHAGAVRGDFDDDDLRIPAGLGTGSRRAWND